MDEDQQIPLLKELMTRPNFLFEENTILLNDLQSDKRYLILIGQALDYTTIPTEYEKETSNIKIDGSKVLFANKYIHVYEIIQQTDFYNIYINDESTVISAREIYDR